MSCDSVQGAYVVLYHGRNKDCLAKVVINQQDDYGNTALHLAAWNCSKGSFKYLLENNADPVSTVTLGNN